MKEFKPTYCRIWQISKVADPVMRFIGYEDFVRKFGLPSLENYTNVFDGPLGTDDPEKIYDICRNHPPKRYRGRKMAVGDIVELYDNAGSRFYYCDRIGFQSLTHIT